MIPVGHISKVTVKENMIRTAISKKHRPVKARLTGEEQAPDWVREAIQAVCLAPSAVNSQRPVFRYTDGRVTADVADNSPTDLIDLRIAKAHFVEAAGGCFDFGNGDA